ncbi:hypothetical protein BLNAU_624 [Blattamonas nauphoetae]|uniref:Transposase n=1 Tax=Blattamonas nauphoetae TaxID=2049346 RepID=A0ABQ9YK17_9EUKA|nr:hypothetical protein BLNAU_624 [Blattamonas nauphoetae]
MWTEIPSEHARAVRESLSQLKWPEFDLDEIVSMILSWENESQIEQVRRLQAFTAKHALPTIPPTTICHILGCRESTVSKAKHGTYYHKIEEKINTVLSREDEELLLKTIEADSLKGNMWIPSEIYQFGKTHSTKDNISKSWAYWFVYRHKSRICFLSAQPMSNTRMSLTTGQIKAFFTTMAQVLQNIHPLLFINADEMGYQQKQDAFRHSLIGSVKLKDRPLHYPVDPSEEQLSGQGEALSVLGQRLIRRSPLVSRNNGLDQPILSVHD